MYTPKILHQTWKTYDIPPKFLKYRQRWFNFTNNYEHFLYNDNDLDKLVSYFPKYYKVYETFTSKIEKVDFSRYVMMYIYGGIYADLDTYPLKSLDYWISKNKIILGREPLEHSLKIYNREIVLCNALMISPPKQKFWLHLMD